MITIEQLFGTLQQSVVATWRKHLRSAKYSKHMALDEFYDEMPDKVDELIEAWMGVNGRKVNGFENILVSKNMGTLKYLQELRSITKQGYPLMNGETELESILDDIVTLIDSTLYKVKELSESACQSLKDYISEALVNESRESLVKESVSFLDSTDYYPSNWDLVDIFDTTNGGKASELKKYDWGEFFDVDFIDAHDKDIVKLYTDFFAACDSVCNSDIGNVDEDGFNDSEVRDAADISDKECGVALHKDGDDGTWTIIKFKKPINKLPKAQQDAIWVVTSKFEEAYYYIEYFDAI